MPQALPDTLVAGIEPIPGYRLLAPLGRGGFGEVWQCEAPGGLHKAIKFVRESDGGACPAAQEQASLERMRSLRHPFILSLERIEVVEGTLVVIMELAEQSLYSLRNQYQDEGLPGIPRDELLGYLGEAAEALDWMSEVHKLQHLDVKPHNLFLTSGHVKVADFGLVRQITDGEGGQRGGGSSPLYSAPEMLQGSLSRKCDQYSLAIVYQQMLTGQVPFWHDNIRELVMLHLTAEPDLAGLPEADRPAVARALAKFPEQRYGSCLEFVRALQGEGAPRLRGSGQWRKVLTGSSPLAESAPPADPKRLTDTPTRRIRALTPAQIAASESARNDLGPPPTPRVPAGTGPSGPPAGSGTWETVRLPDRTAVTPSSGDENLPAPTSVSLPGYRFLTCLSQTPLGDLWRAEDPDGRPMRALSLLGFVRYDTRLIAHLQALRDPVLPPADVVWSPAERLVIVTPEYEGTLRDRFDLRRSEGGAGVPRGELLSLLGSAAAALDALAARYGMQHLGVNPRNLLVDADDLRPAEFGVIPLVWLPTGQSAAAINARYAAPELADRRPSRSADQYSLALIFAEMLTGVHPRPQRAAGSGSGLIRRPPAGKGSGVRPAKIDLDMLPAHDREIVARALTHDPEARWPSATAFVEALRTADREESPEENLYDTLPPVIPYVTLMGQPAGPDTIIPPVSHFFRALTASADPTAVAGPNNSRYFVLPDGSWEYRCPLQLFPGAMELKVEGLRGHWNGRITQKNGDSFKLQLDVPIQRSFWERVVRQARRCEVDVYVEPMSGTHTRLTEARVRVRYPDTDREQVDRVLGMMAPQIFDSVRLYLQATTEQRGRERVPLNHPVRVYAVRPDLETAEPVEGVCRNISTGGISFRMPTPPETDYLYLHLHQSPQALGYALLVRVVRKAEAGDQWEIGAAFWDPLVAMGVTPA